jgi:hypothetical protein
MTGSQQIMETFRIAQGAGHTIENRRKMILLKSDGQNRLFYIFIST